MRFAIACAVAGATLLLMQYPAPLISIWRLVEPYDVCVQRVADKIYESSEDPYAESTEYAARLAAGMECGLDFNR